MTSHPLTPVATMACMDQKPTTNLDPIPRTALEWFAVAVALGVFVAGGVAIAFVYSVVRDGLAG